MSDVDRFEINLMREFRSCGGVQPRRLGHGPSAWRKAAIVTLEQKSNTGILEPSEMLHE